jgi:hypothetical protein
MRKSIKNFIKWENFLSISVNKIKKMLSMVLISIQKYKRYVLIKLLNYWINFSWDLISVSKMVNSQEDTHSITKKDGPEPENKI